MPLPEIRIRVKLAGFGEQGQGLNPGGPDRFWPDELEIRERALVRSMSCSARYASTLFLPSSARLNLSLRLTEPAAALERSSNLATVSIARSCRFKKRAKPAAALG